MKTKIVDNQKLTEKLYVFNIGCLSHPKKATTSCFLKNYRLFRLYYEDKSCLELKTTEKQFSSS